MLGPIIISYASSTQLSSTFERVAKTDNFNFLKALMNLLRFTSLKCMQDLTKCSTSTSLVEIFPRLIVLITFEAYLLKLSGKHSRSFCIFYLLHKPQASIGYAYPVDFFGVYYRFVSFYTLYLQDLYDKLLLTFPLLMKY